MNDWSCQCSPSNEKNYKLIIKALIMTHEVARIESNIYLKYATLADIYRQSCYSGGGISCKTMPPLIAGCALNARPLAPGDWDFLWATGSCFTGRPRGDRIL